MSTIPANQLVDVVPNVLPAGGNALDLNGLLLTTSTRIPIGTVASFPSATAVKSYFGSGSAEGAAADIYFRGYNNSARKPGAVLMAQYNSAAVAGFLRGGRSGLTLTQLQAIAAGTLTIVVGGVSKTSSSVDLSPATSFSNAAAIITAAFTSPGFAVTYDSTAGAFLVTSTATGAAATIAYPTTNAFATALFLTQATGAVISQGADAAVPGTFMDGVASVSQNWAGFTTIFNPDTSGVFANKLLFAAWNNSQDDSFVYAGWDPDLTGGTSNPATGSFGYAVNVTNEYSGTMVIFSPTCDKAVFALGIAASIDFTKTNGRTTFAFRGQSGLVADVTDETTAQNFIANGYNFYGAYATRNDQFVEFQPGSISGPFVWADSYVNQIWMNNEFQLALMVLLQNAPSIPYNFAGRAMIQAACADVILAAGNFGAFRPGVTLSEMQKSQVNAAAGVDISGVLQTTGNFLQVKDSSPETRAARESPPCTFWYMDGGSVQKIVLVSTEVQ